MNFGDLVFWQHLFGCLAVLLILRAVAIKTRCWKPRADAVLLLVLSLYLFSQIDLRSFLIFILVSSVSYLAAGLLFSAPRRIQYLGLTVALPVLFFPLVYFKYYGFLFNPGATSPVLSVGIPIGLSFYTFQKAAFLVDTVIRRQQVPRLLDFLNFAAFFPQLVAGPIERRDSLLPQVTRFRFRFMLSCLRLGTNWIIIGLFFKCVLADNLAAILPHWQYDLSNPVSIWISAGVFGGRIYYDFAGYSLIAFGLARCLGIRLTLNFRSPYLSTSMQEFWRRWHITLSQWFRDYLYIPLGGGRVPWAWLNIFLVFAISGLWHGAGWNFIIWGGMHGLLVSGQHVTRKMAFQVPRFLGWLFTTVSVFVLWLCFYETNLAHLFAKLTTLMTPSAYTWNAPSHAFHGIIRGDMAFIFAIFFLAGITHLVEWISVAHYRRAYRAFHRTWVLCLLVFAIVCFTRGVQNSFIYFAF